MTQHTPGPWHAQPGYHGDERIYISAGERSGLVAQVNPYRAADEQQSNAALISAAPEMIHALRLARGSLIGAIDEAERNETLTAIRAAIAKAEGR